MNRYVLLIVMMGVVASPVLGVWEQQVYWITNTEVVNGSGNVSSVSASYGLVNVGGSSDVVLTVDNSTVCTADNGLCGGNSSWNEGYADTLYYSISNPNGYISSYTETDPLWTGNESRVDTLENEMNSLENLSTSDVSGIAPNITIGTDTGGLLSLSNQELSVNDVYLLNDGDAATGNYTFDTDTLFIDSTGNAVGIGTSSPGYELEVVGDIGTDSIIGTSGSAGDITISGRPTVKASLTNGNGLFDLISNNENAYWRFQATDNGGAFIFRDVASSTNPLSILKGSPTQSLQIETGELVVNGLGEDYDFRVESDTDAHALFVQGSDGNVGIGTSSPGHSLEVQGNGRAASFVLSGNGGIEVEAPLNNNPAVTLRENANDKIAVGWNAQSTSANRIADSFEVYSYAAGDTIFSIHEDAAGSIIVDSDGNVGIGTNSPALKLEVQDNSVSSALLQLDNSAGQCDATPSSGSLSWSCTSDERVKPDIQPVNTNNVLEELKNRAQCLRQYHILETREHIEEDNTTTYTHATTTDWSIGYSAQCLQTIKPELVGEKTDFTGYLWNDTAQSTYFVENYTLYNVEQPNVNELLVGIAELYKRNKDTQEELILVRGYVENICSNYPGACT